MHTATIQRSKTSESSQSKAPGAPSAPARKTLQFHKTPIPFTTLNRHYYAFVHSDQHYGYVRGHGFDKIRLEKGKLYVDDIPILNPAFGSDTITWKQQTETHFSRGYLYFAKNGLEVHGTIHLGTTPQDATAHHTFGTSVPIFASSAAGSDTISYGTDSDASSYVSQLTKLRYKQDGSSNPSTLTADQWQTGLVLKLATDDDFNTIVLLGDQDITDYVAWSANKDPKVGGIGDLVMSFDIGDDSFLYCPDDSTSFYITGRLIFDAAKAVPTFQGTVTTTCKNETGTDAYFWKGQADPAQVAAMNATLRTTPVKAPAAVSFSATDLLAFDTTPTIDDLLTIAPDDTVASMAHDLLVEDMKWAISQNVDEKDWLAQFFGETPPTLSQDRIDLINKSLAWYQQDFAKSYLGQSFQSYAGPNAPTVRLSDAQALKLKNFVQVGLGQDQNLTIQQNGLYLEAFKLSKPELQPYLADAQTWAQQLYDTITDKTHFKQLYLLFKTAHDMTLANRWSTLLSVLDSSGQLASQFNLALIKGTLANTTLDVSPQDPLVIMDWLPKWLQVWLDQITVDPSKLPTEGQLAAEQLKDLLAQNGGDMVKVAGLVSGFLANAVGSNLLQKTQNAASAFAAEYPKLTSLGNMFFYVGFSLGITMVVQAFMKWDQLTDDDKGRAVTATVGLSFEAVKIVPEMINGFKDNVIAGYKKFQDWLSDTPAQDGVGDIGKRLAIVDTDEEWVKFSIGKIATGAETMLEVEGTLWSKIMVNALKVVAVVGVVVAAVFAVFATIDFVRDIQSNQPIAKESLDGIMAAASIASVVCLALDLVIASAIFAVAAAVLAIIGVIAAIIAMFVVKPDNPLDDFMSNVIIPFVDGLDPKYNQAPAAA